jgi:hypothetical protein
MSKLDEIEARVKRETDLGATEWLGPSARAVDLAYVSLLIRAVRQLGDVYLSTFPRRELDPDVLELINE